MPLFTAHPLADVVVADHLRTALEASGFEFVILAHPRDDEAEAKVVLFSEDGPRAASLAGVMDELLSGRAQLVSATSLMEAVNEFRAE